MKLLVFDLHGGFAYFKSPEGSRSNYSFPFPPKTALVGLMAGIMGEVRNAYWENPSYRDMKIGVQILKTPRTMGIKMNYWRSKTTVNVKKVGNFILPGSDAKSRGYTTQVKFDFLQNVEYRIYVSCEQELWDKLSKRIKERRYVFPPYLGHANLLAEIEFVGVVDAEEITEGDFVSTVPVSALDKEHPLSELYSTGVFEIYPSVPAGYSVAVSANLDGRTFYSSVPLRFETVVVPKGRIHAAIIPGCGYRLTVNGETVEVVLA